MVSALERRQPQRTESDADYSRVKRRTAARLMRSLRQYVRELQDGGQDGELPAQTAFIRRHTQLLRHGYTSGHKEGQRDYWAEVSLKRARVAAPDEAGQARMHRRVAFYLPSVVKMATEIQRAWHETQRQEAHKGAAPVKQFADPASGQVDASALDQLMAQMDWRVQLQAEVSWVGLQDGYAAGGASDPAGVYDVLYWDLEPGAQHCLDCILMADSSPFTIDRLNQTPGDGQTECGASCKCDLRAGVSSAALEGATASVAQRLPNDYTVPPQFPGGVAATSEPVPAPPAETPLSREQKGALDSFRSALDGWDRVRGELPPLETLLAPADGPEAEAWAGVTMDQLTPEQSAALDAYVQALGAWGATFAEPADATETATAAPWDVPPIELPQRPTYGPMEPPAPLPPEMQLPGQPPVVLPERPVEGATYAPPGEPIAQLPGVPPIELPQRPPSVEQVQQTTDTASVNGETTRDIVRVTVGEDTQALGQLNAGQRAALDDLRGVELLWDAVRGQLPPFAEYFDPTSALNLWQNRDLAGLSATQRELVRRFFQAAGAWQAATKEGSA